MNLFQPNSMLLSIFEVQCINKNAYMLNTQFFCCLLLKHDYFLKRNNCNIFKIKKNVRVCLIHSVKLLNLKKKKGNLVL